MRFYALEKLINLHDNYSRQFRIDSVSLLLLQRRGDLFLLEASCPHRGHSLTAAKLDLDRGFIECALHQYRFSLRSGQLLHATEEPCRALRTFNLVYEGNEVGVVLED